MTIRALSPRHGAWKLLALAAACLVQGCNTVPPTASGTRLYHSDLTGGAKVCEVPKVSLTLGQETATTMTVGNDGGWCGITVSQSGPRPFSVGLLTARPAHGKVYVHTVGDETRVDYTPDTGFAGSDTFTAKLVPGGGLMRVVVTVKPKA